MTNKIDVSIKGFIKLLRNTFFLRDGKKTDMDRFLEMRFTKSPSTEDGVKASQMLWGI